MMIYRDILKSLDILYVKLQIMMIYQISQQNYALKSSILMKLTLFNSLNKKLIFLFHIRKIYSLIMILRIHMILYVMIYSGSSIYIHLLRNTLLDILFVVKRFMNSQLAAENDNCIYTPVCMEMNGLQQRF